MSDQTHDNRTLTSYLLGSLPESETERLDELSIADDHFAAALEIAETDLVDAYVNNELAGDELSRFRKHYLASPLRRQKVQFAQTFQSWAEKKSVAIMTSDAQAQPKRKKAGWLSAFSFTAPRPVLQWSFAAAMLILLIAGVWLVSENLHLRRQVLQAQSPTNTQVSPREQELKNQLDEQRAANARTEQELAQLHTERDRLEAELEKRGVQQRPLSPAIASFILTPQLRSAGQIKTITIPNGTERVAVHLRLEPNDYSNYKVMLIEQGVNRIVWRSANLRARGSADAKTLTINFPVGLLTAQNYMLKVSGTDESGASEILSDYPFRVVK